MLKETTFKKYCKLNSGPNFRALLTGKQIFVLTIAEQNCLSIRVFHRLEISEKENSERRMRVHSGFVLFRH